MGQPFANPVVGGGGALVVPVIRSPNFSISGQTGWAIMSNGDAYFYDVVATGITSTTVVVSGAGEGVFTYSGTPAAGNLISTTGIAVTGDDAYGNAYLLGDTSYVSGSPYVATQLNAGQVGWFTAATYAGPYTFEAGIGFQYVNGIGGGLVLEGALTPIYDSNPVIVGGQTFPPGYPANGTLASATNVVNQVVSILQGAGLW